MLQDDLAAQWRYRQGNSAHVCDAGMRHIFIKLSAITPNPTHRFRKQLSIDTRINVLSSPKASLQVYMQPLVVVGDYMDFKSLARPRTFDFDPYTPALPFDPDFDFKSLQANAIFRWEWRLGSTLYIAWTQQRQDLSNPGQCSFTAEVLRVYRRQDNPPL